MIALDTHALVWWALAPEKLSRRAAQVLVDVEQRGGMVSAISIWEIANKVRLGKLELPIAAAELARRSQQEGSIELVAVDTDIWLRTADLAWDHRDPADRVIVATAHVRGVPILTKDAVMHTQKLVECVW